MSPARFGRLAFLAVAGVLVTAVITATPASASDTITRWDQFSESSDCGDPYTKTPYMSGSGYLGDSRSILGPFGTYFGRTVGEARGRQVTWVVPYSGGKTIRVHEAALPAFQRVAETLDDHAEWGRVYWISSVGGFYPRTIAGSYQLSRHALGLSIDINPAQNPYRSDNKLITNMPTWFVEAWRDAGFCWGGDWKYAKDSMHFSWRGPGAGGPSGDLSVTAPRTSLRPFSSQPQYQASTALAPVLNRYQLLIGDTTGNGAPDVSGIRSHADGAVLDIATGTGGYRECSVSRWFIPDSRFVGADFTILADINGDSRQDLVALLNDGSSVTAVTATRRGEYEDATAVGTSLPPDLVAVTAADYDGDHLADLWSVSSDGTLRVFAGPSWDTVLGTFSLPTGVPEFIAASDRDGGGVPEVFALYTGGELAVLRQSGSWVTDQSLELGDNGTLAVGAGDFDGDGRADFQTLDSSGRLTAYLGNASTGRAPTSWFENPQADCDEYVPLVFTGTFHDDDLSVHQNGIEFIASRRITVGCNPPFNDEFCPSQSLTRAQAATFIARAIGLAEAQSDFFIDDTGHVLEGAVNRVAAAGLTQGCNPPTNNRFCPDRTITRAEFGTLLVRALGLPETTVDYFTDDDGHVLEGPINRLAAAGITQGCNPPVNDRFCPNSGLTRAEAATFLTRAFK